MGVPGDTIGTPEAWRGERDKRWGGVTSPPSRRRPTGPPVGGEEVTEGGVLIVTHRPGSTDEGPTTARVHRRLAGGRGTVGTCGEIKSVGPGTSHGRDLRTRNRSSGPRGSRSEMDGRGGQGNSPETKFPHLDPEEEGHSNATPILGPPLSLRPDSLVSEESETQSVSLPSHLPRRSSTWLFLGRCLYRSLTPSRPTVVVSQTSRSMCRFTCGSTSLNLCPGLETSEVGT